MAALSSGGGGDQKNYGARYAKAAARSNAAAQYNLGVCYAEGEGVARQPRYPYGGCWVSVQPNAMGPRLDNQTPRHANHPRPIPPRSAATRR